MRATSSQMHPIWTQLQCTYSAVKILFRPQIHTVQGDFHL